MLRVAWTTSWLRERSCATRSSSRKSHGTKHQRCKEETRGRVAAKTSGGMKSNPSLCSCPDNARRLFFATYDMVSCDGICSLRSAHHTISLLSASHPAEFRKAQVETWKSQDSVADMMWVGISAAKQMSMCATCQYRPMSGRAGHGLAGMTVRYMVSAVHRVALKLHTICPFEGVKCAESSSNGQTNWTLISVIGRGCELDKFARRRIRLLTACWHCSSQSSDMSKGDATPDAP